MRRLPRILLNAATAGSLLLCVGTVGLWVRSYRAEDMYGWYDSRWSDREHRLRATGLVSDSGGVYLFLLRRSVTLSDDEAHEGWFHSFNPQRRMFSHRHGDPLGYPTRPDYPGWGRFGFEIRWGQPAVALRPSGLYDSRLTHRDAFLVIPHAFAAAVLAAGPAMSLCRRRRRARATRRGRCPTCGYDLRATPDRCPECGTIPV